MLFFRLLILAGFVYALYYLVKNFVAASRRHQPPTVGESMVLDPQCNTYLPKSSALLRQGKYFCSEECAQKFLKS